LTGGSKCRGGGGNVTPRAPFRARAALTAMVAVNAARLAAYRARAALTAMVAVNAARLARSAPLQR
jgi:hypothetical protein